MLDAYNLLKHWKAITHGTVHIIDKDTQKLAAIIRITPYTELSASRQAELQRVIMRCNTHYYKATPITCNGASRTEEGIIGHIGGIGYRKSMSLNEAFGLYRSDRGQVAYIDKQIHGLLGKGF